MLTEVRDFPPAEFHYMFRRGTDTIESRDAAVAYLSRQGCTLTIHSGTDSYGIVEPIEVVRQRALEPRYD